MSKSTNLRRARARQTPATGEVESLNGLIRIARANWLGLLSYLAFTGVTLLGIQDVDFFITERETALPLIGVTVPTALFFYFAPVLGGMLYIHLHFYLMKLWRALALAAPVQNGTPLSEAIQPSVMAQMALRFRHGARPRLPLGWLSDLVAFGLIFLAAPALLAAFWVRSMPKHDPWLTLAACGVPLFLAILMGSKSFATLRLRMSGHGHSPGPVAHGLWLLLLGFIMATGWATTQGLPDRIARATGVDPLDTIYPANLENAVFIQTPPDWRPDAEAEQIYRRKWCKSMGMTRHICGPGPLDETARAPAYQPFQRLTWCQNLFGPEVKEATCTAHFRSLDRTYAKA